MNEIEKREIIYLPPQKLVPYSNNAKAHSPDQIAQLAGMIAQYKTIVPILVDAGHVIISGHGRREAAIQLAIQEIPVIVADYLSEDEVAALRIADNKSADSPFNLDTLRFELNTLKSHGFDLKLTGFPEFQIGDFLETGFMPETAFETRTLGTEFAEGKRTTEDYRTEAEAFTEANGEASKKVVHWLYVEFETEEELEFVKAAIGKGAGKVIDKDKLIECLKKTT